MMSNGVLKIFFFFFSMRKFLLKMCSHLSSLSMLSIRETISRIGKSIRQIDSLSKTNKPPNKPHPRNERQVLHKENKYLPNEKLAQLKPMYTDFQRKVFQDFLKPIEIPNLKTFNKKEEYDSALASRNWNKRASQKPQDVLDTFLADKPEFDKLIKYLLEITPPHLKNIDYHNELTIRRILDQEAIRAYDVPHHAFHEIPPIPSPLTKDSFEQYIYHLTHCKFHYRNSLSLQSGIIPHILLYTHKTTTTKFRPFRSTTTFNWLIKYFGHDKNQSSFARELLLVMNIEGHLLNTETINNLLKVVKVHSRIRANANSFTLALKYLKLSQKLGIDVNLLTWSKVYDIIHNVHLKEAFISFIQENGIPILRGLLLRIIDDFATIASTTEDLIYFIENDLGFKHWENDDIIRAKVIFHRARVNGGPFTGSNEYDFKNWLLGLKNSTQLSSLLMLQQYFGRTIEIHETIPIFSIIIESLVDEYTDIRHLKQLVFVVRGMIYEATHVLSIPCEIIQYADSQTIPENYKMLARILYGKLHELQARVEFTNSHTFENISLPWEMLSQEEIEKWMALTNKIKNDQAYQLFPHLQDSREFPKTEIDKIMSHIKAKGVASRNRTRVDKITQGFDDYTVALMKERSLL